MDNDSVIGFDEAFEGFLRTMPYSLHSYFEKLIKEGFNEEQSFALVRDYQKYVLVGYSSDKNEED